MAPLAPPGYAYAENVKYNQNDFLEDLQFFSIAMDESTDTIDT